LRREGKCGDKIGGGPVEEISRRDCGGHYNAVCWSIPGVWVIALSDNGVVDFRFLVDNPESRNKILILQYQLTLVMILFCLVREIGKVSEPLPDHRVCIGSRFGASFRGPLTKLKITHSITDLGILYVIY
jgi:hypothetical protein